MKNLHIDWVNDFDKWNHFIKSCPTGTLFSNTEFLQACQIKFQIRGVFKGEELKAGMIFLSEENNLVMNDLIIYGGPILQNLLGKKGAKNQKEMDWLQLLAEDIETQFDAVQFACSPHLIDTRAFQWVNYHNNQRQYQIAVRYTALLNISALSSSIPFMDTAFFQQMETLRQRNYRAALKEGLEFNLTIDVPRFINDYAQLMQDQNSPASPFKLSQLTSLLEFLFKKQQAIQYNTIVNGECVYSIIMALENHKAYYLFGAPSASTKSNLGGTFCFLKSFQDLAQHHQIRDVDLEGANSPQRGAYKMSFGADLVPYFRMTLL